MTRPYHRPRERCDGRGVHWSTEWTRSSGYRPVPLLALGLRSSSWAHACGTRFVLPLVGILGIRTRRGAGTPAHLEGGADGARVATSLHLRPASPAPHGSVQCSPTPTWDLQSDTSDLRPGGRPRKSGSTGSEERPSFTCSPAYTRTSSASAAFRPRIPGLVGPPTWSCRAVGHRGGDMEASNALLHLRPPGPSRRNDGFVKRTAVVPVPKPFL